MHSHETSEVKSSDAVHIFTPTILFDRFKSILFSVLTYFSDYHTFVCLILILCLSLVQDFKSVRAVCSISYLHYTFREHT